MAAYIYLHMKLEGRVGMLYLNRKMQIKDLNFWVPMFFQNVLEVTTSLFILKLKT